MRFCSQCAEPLERRVPPGDDRERDVCTGCGVVHYVNPRMVVGCLVEHGGGVLLCKRSIEPALDKWTLPAGFLELGESSFAGARRETWEEACARVEIVAPHAFLDVPHIGQTHAFFRASLSEPRWAAGSETSEVAVFPLDDLPWDQLSFPMVHFALRLHLADREAGRAHMHLGTTHWDGAGDPYDIAHYELRDHLAVPLG
jgi:ADP-ribose/FAD diphosphatase